MTSGSNISIQHIQMRWLVCSWGSVTCKDSLTRYCNFENIFQISLLCWTCLSSALVLCCCWTCTVSLWILVNSILPQSASGTGLAFIAFTEAVLEMPGSQVWAILFFVMLFSLGLSSMFGNIEGVLTPIKDLKLLPKWIPLEVVTGSCKLALTVLQLKEKHFPFEFPLWDIYIYIYIYIHFLRSHLLVILPDQSHLHPGFWKLLGGGL